MSNPTQNGVLKKDDNGYPVMGGTSSVDNSTIVNCAIDPVTRRLLTNQAGSTGITSINTDTTAAQLLVVGTSGTDFAIADNGTGTHTFNLPTASATNRGALSSTDWSTFNGKVSSVSVASANGFAGSSSGGATPALTLTTTVTGVLKGNGTAISAASAGTDYVAPGSITTSGLTMNTAKMLGRATAAAGAIEEIAVTGSGSAVLATSPTLTTPNIGVATATTVNKVTITAPASGSTLTIADGKTLTANNSITLAGTDSTTMTFPSTSATIARTDAAQTFTGAQTYSNQVVYTNNAITASGNAATVPITARLNTVTNNSAATLTITMTTTSAVDGQMTIVRILDASAVAQTITWVNTENSTISAPTTSNGSTTLPLTVGFMYNSATSKWRCLASS